MRRRTFLETLPGLPLATMPLAAAAEKTAGKSRLRTAICAYSFRKELGDKSMSYDDLVRLAVDLNVDGLDLTVYWFPNTSDEFLLPLRRLAYRSGVEIYSISVRTELTRPDAALRRQEWDGLRKWVDVANKLGASHIRVFGGKVPDGVSEDHAAGWVVDGLRNVEPYAASKGVILGLENHGGITTKAQRILEIVRKVDSPWVGINLDTGNFESDAYEQIEMCVPYAVNVQVKAEVRGAGGKREPSDWAKVVGMLTKAGYKGYLALEYEEKDDARKAVPRYIQRLKEVTSR
jgi:sugar phosphate isomerase/epimerase